MCDVPRQLTKLPTCGKRAPGVTDEDILVEKAAGYIYCDKNTPIIGPFVRRVAELAESRVARALGVGSKTDPETELTYNAREYTSDQQYPNEDSNWMQAMVEEAIPDFYWGAWDLFMDSAYTLDKCLHPPMCVPEKPHKPSTASVVVAGELVPGTKPDELPSQTAEEASLRLKAETKPDPKGQAAPARPARLADKGKEKAGPRPGFGRGRGSHFSRAGFSGPPRGGKARGAQAGGGRAR